MPLNTHSCFTGITEYKHIYSVNSYKWLYLCMYCIHFDRVYKYRNSCTKQQACNHVILLITWFEHVTTFVHWDVIFVLYLRSYREVLRRSQVKCSCWLDVVLRHEIKPHCSYFICTETSLFLRENLPGQFKFKEYCPQVFRNLRERFGIEDQDYQVWL